jgi:hypothetical protein
VGIYSLKCFSGILKKGKFCDFKRSWNVKLGAVFYLGEFYGSEVKNKRVKFEVLPKVTIKLLSFGT